MPKKRVNSEPIVLPRDVVYSRILLPLNLAQIVESYIVFTTNTLFCARPRFALQDDNSYQITVVQSSHWHRIQKIMYGYHYTYTVLQYDMATLERSTVTTHLEFDHMY